MHLSQRANPAQSDLAYYRKRFGLVRVTEYLSAETSVYNSPFALSSEVSVYRFSHATGLVQALRPSPASSVSSTPRPLTTAVYHATSATWTATVTFPTGFTTL